MRLDPADVSIEFREIACGNIFIRILKNSIIQSIFCLEFQCYSKNFIKSDLTFQLLFFNIESLE